jgi:hypothetical protein
LRYPEKLTAAAWPDRRSQPKISWAVLDMTSLEEDAVLAHPLQ